jgi:hypothetical protein
LNPRYSVLEGDAILFIAERPNLIEKIGSRRTLFTLLCFSLRAQKHFAVETIVDLQNMREREREREGEGRERSRKQIRLITELRAAVKRKREKVDKSWRSGGF